MTSGKPLTDEQKQHILNNGKIKSIRSIADELGLNRYTVSQILSSEYEKSREKLIKEGMSFPLASKKAYKEIYGEDIVVIRTISEN